jgi:hypothetical protein
MSARRLAVTVLVLVRAPLRHGRGFADALYPSGAMPAL